MGGLERLLRPRSIAVIGGGTWCANVIVQSRAMGFSGDLWSVHPTRDEIGGLSPFRRIDDLPHAPDAAFIGVNRDATIEAVGTLSRVGTGGAVCFASGFREADGELGDGAAKEAALLDAAGDMTLLGPNCYGLLNYLDRVTLWPDQHGGTRVANGVAIITQSSNIAINLTMQARGLPLAYVVTAGNQAQTGIAALADVILQDERVTALGLHMEGVGDLRAFERMAARARALGKPVVAIKMGASDQARAAAVSHTASLAGSDAGATALFQRLGIGRAASLPVFLETLKLLHFVGPLPSGRVAAISCSGGEASLAADTVAASADLSLPPLEKTQETALRTTLGPRVALANPLDYHTYIWGDEDAMAEMFTAMAAGDVAVTCAILDFPRADRCDGSAWEPTIRALAKAQRATGKPIAVVATLPETLPEDMGQRLIAAGLIPLLGLSEAVSALAIAAALGRPCLGEAPLLAPACPLAGRVLTEAQSKACLAAHGVVIPRAAQANCATDAAAEAERIGFPVVLKTQGLAHKSEAGAVILGLGSGSAVERVANDMARSEFLVEEMICDGVAELLVGIVSDPAHGFVLTLAAGGTLTELLQDRACLLLPASRRSVRDALMGLRVAPLLKGYRGQPAANLDVILDAVMAVQEYVGTHRPQEVEINPLICTPTRAVAADALIRTGD